MSEGRRARNRRERERSYLDAAMDLAGREGLRGLTMQRLADACSAAVGTVYTYFPSKGALIAELQRESIERLLTSYRHTKRRSGISLAGWHDPQAEAVARLMVFGRFWLSTVDTLANESSFLHALVGESEETVPPEEFHRSAPAALELLDEARSEVATANRIGAITVDDAMDVVIRWASALTGVLMVSNLAPLNPRAFDGRRLGPLLQRDLLAGWGACAELIERAEAHVKQLEADGPLAPRLIE